jgi:peptide deformylase
MNYTVKRPAAIRVKYQDYMGNQRMTWLYNLPARFWLKGYDHTLGLTPYDRDNNTTTKLPEEHLYVKN